jgi:cob(I)alamin adenosyltransferase
MLDKGLVQVYTGDGKGKTTAALGLALRAAGRGNKVLFYQFLKHASLETGERIALESQNLLIHLRSIDVEWDMQRSFRDSQVMEQARSAIHDALTEIAEFAARRQYDVIVLDEIVFCVSKGLAKFKDVRKIIDQRNPAVEIVLTGRDASAELIEKADLVTEMKPIKHPFDRGIPARKGIEY